MLDESVYMEITSPFNPLIGQSTVVLLDLIWQVDKSQALLEHHSGWGWWPPAGCDSAVYTQLSSEWPSASQWWSPLPIKQIIGFYISI